MFRQKRLGTAVAVVAAALLLLSAIGGGSALAAKNNTAGHGGHKSGGGGSTTPCATCVFTVTPNPIPFGTSSIAVSGSGFAANQTVYVDMSPDLLTHSITTDGNGFFSMPYSHTWNIAGTNAAYGRVYDNASALGTPLAEAWLSVCSTNPC